MAFKLSPGVFVRECDGSPREPQINYSKFQELAGYYLSLMDGDTHQIEDAFELLREFGIVDADGERIYEDEDEEDETTQC